LPNWKLWYPWTGIMRDYYYSLCDKQRCGCDNAEFEVAKPDADKLVEAGTSCASASTGLTQEVWVRQIIKAKQSFQRVEVTREEALLMFEENKFKVEIISNLVSGSTITLYRSGEMVDLCRSALNMGGGRMLSFTSPVAARQRKVSNSRTCSKVSAVFHILARPTL